MSSFAPAPLQPSDAAKSPARQIPFGFVPDAPPPPAYDAPNDAVRVERLLSQIEARSMALVPYTHAQIPTVEKPRSYLPLLVGVLIGLWLSSLPFVIAYFHNNGGSPFIDRAAATMPAGPLVIAPGAADSSLSDRRVDARPPDLSAAAAERSSPAPLPALPKSSRGSRRRLSAKPLPRNAAPSPPAAQLPTVVASIPNANPPRNNWHQVLDVKPTAAAVAHTGSDGAIDYWTVARGKDTLKVLPIGKDAGGVVVHNLDDGKDYTLTSAGDWKPAPSSFDN